MAPSGRSDKERGSLVQGKKPVTHHDGTAQLAIVGDKPDALLLGVDTIGPLRVDLVVPPGYEKEAEILEGRIDDLGADPTSHAIEGEALLGTIQLVRKLAVEMDELYDDVLMNLAGADRTMACAGLSAAFVAGVKSFDVVDDEIVFLPVLHFSYKEVVSDAKLHILKALDGMGGSCKRLRDLSQASDLQDSLVSYHIRGGREGRGLEDLGLVDVHRGARGSLTIQLTPMGRLLAKGLTH